MSNFKHPGPWTFGLADVDDSVDQKPFDYTGPGYYDNPYIFDAHGKEIIGCDEYNVFLGGADVARLCTAAPELLEALQKALDFIDDIRQELHNRRTADWYPEGANNAALSMSEDMRLLGNACADFSVGDVLSKATGA